MTKISVTVTATDADRVAANVTVGTPIVMARPLRLGRGLRSESSPHRPMIPPQLPAAVYATVESPMRYNGRQTVGVTLDVPVEP